MLNKFWIWIGNSINNARNSGNMIASPKPRQLSTSGDEIENDRTVQFKIIAAEGGLIFKAWSYDPSKDQSKQRLYLIPDGEDVATNVARLVSIEMLRS